MADDARALDALLRRDFLSFIQKTFGTVSPGDEFVPNWHLEAIAWALLQCLNDGIKRLIITLPPRSLKSICASVAFPAFALGHDPTLRFICASYSTDLARKHALDCRAVMESDWYRRIFPGTRLHPEKNTELEVMTRRRGFRLSTSVGGTLTGRGGNIVIIDDPMKPSEAMSDLKRETVKQWFDGTLYSRLDSKEEGVVIVIMQRLHVDDLAAHLLDKGGWVHLNIPAIAPCDQVYEIGDDEVHHRRAGEVLHPERESLDSLLATKSTVGSFDFAAQYQQEPVPPGGGMIKLDWFRSYASLPERGPGSQIVQSWDTASKAEEINDYSVCTTWLVEGDDAYLIHISRDRLEYPALKKRIRDLSDQMGADVVLIEDKGSGTSLIQDLGDDGLRCVAIQPDGDKVTRMSAVSARIEAGYVYLPEQAPWLPDFQTEVLRFPRGRHDDQVDSMSQFLRWHRDHRQSYLLTNIQLPDLRRPSYWRDY
jgi:predicted phage terminase large subunit-like protein